MLLFSGVPVIRMRCAVLSLRRRLKMRELSDLTESDQGSARVAWHEEPGAAKTR